MILTQLINLHVVCILITILYFVRFFPSKLLQLILRILKSDLILRTWKYSLKDLVLHPTPFAFLK